jgi:hypothetical protein
MEEEFKEPLQPSMFFENQERLLQNQHPEFFDLRDGFYVKQTGSKQKRRYSFSDVPQNDNTNAIGFNPNS